jgi:hypothetical protein
VYSVGLASKAPQPEIAKDFIARFSAASSRSLLVDAGYELS